MRSEPSSVAGMPRPPAWSGSTPTSPAHHRSTGHVRHAPGVHAGGRAQDAGENHRLEHLRGFLADVARAIPEHDPVWLMGPGQTHGRLAELLADDDREHGRERALKSTACRAAERPPADRQGP